MIVRRAGLLGVAALSFSIWACGGKVVIVPDEMGGDGGGTSSGIVCSWPAPVGSLGFCGGSSSGGDCSSAYCDINGNVYESVCSGSSCQCRYNTQVSCTCAANDGTDYCSDGVPSCCPFPTP